ncbi:hypothetical protein PMAYCL1PPCAC_05119, partial [Pristionchus mayeri]
AEAFVNYDNAVLYDEFDLSTLKTFPLTECLALSCKVYVSAPKSSLDTLERIYLGDTTLATLAGQVDETTGLKTPYELNAFSGKAFISNINWMFKSAPVAIYIVFETAPFYESGLVYDPSYSPAIKGTSARTLTILSASNFTIKGSVTKGSLAGGRVIASGFDFTESKLSRTPALYDVHKEKSFELSFAGPLATLYTSRNHTSELSFDIAINEGFSGTLF